MDDDKRDRAVPEVEESERGEHNRIGYYNADEEKTHDEQGGTQGPEPSENPREDA
jgi:hypothetical protein